MNWGPFFLYAVSADLGGMAAASKFHKGFGKVQNGNFRSTRSRAC
jgi:hypothetical protein